jgi:TolB-like protein/Tfp pilus assembly protein PilF
VYLAEDTRLRRKVALKLLPSDLADSPQAKQRLLAEARAAANLDHPNICPVFEVGEHEGQSFIAMQYLEGELLDHRLQAGAMDTADAVRIAAQIADALSEAHEQGIVHRDIKPANVMIGRRGEARVMDFGVAKIQIDDANETMAATAMDATAAGQLIGTIPYMAPEQVRGEPVDARSDIFSLGVMTYEMVTGRHPFAARTTPDTFVSILSSSPPPVHEAVPDVPAELERILGRTLEKDRARRYQHARDLALDLQELTRAMTMGTAAPWASSAGNTPAVPGLPAAQPGSLPGTATAAAGTLPGVAAPTAAPAAMGRGRIAAWVIAGIAFALGAYWIAGIDSDDATPAGPTAAVEAQISLAVLPLINETGDDDLLYLTDGLAEGLMNDLSRLGNIRVTSRSSAFRYRDADIDPGEIGRALGVNTLVTGRVRRAGDRLDVSIDLIDARDNRHLWGAQYSATDDLVALRQQISRAVAGNLRPGSNSETVAAAIPEESTSPEAYRMYLRGNYQYNRFLPESMGLAIEAYQDAIELDSDFALAYAGLARTYGMMAGNFVPAGDVIEGQRDAANRAVDLDVGLADAHFSRARVLHRWDFDWPEAETSYRLALRLNPSLADAHTAYASWLWSFLRFDEAQEHIRSAIELDPFSLYHNLSYGIGFMMNRQYDLALEQFQATRDLNPDYARTYTNLSEVQTHLGHHEEAIANALHAEQLRPTDPFVIETVGYAYAAAGRTEEAREYLARLTRSEVPVNPIVVAQLQAALGNVDAAFDWIDRAVQERNPWLLTLPFHPKLDPLRDDPRFDAALRAINLEPTA